MPSCPVDAWKGWTLGWKLSALSKVASLFSGDRIGLGVPHGGIKLGENLRCGSSGRRRLISRPDTTASEISAIG